MEFNDYIEKVKKLKNKSFMVVERVSGNEDANEGSIIIPKLYLSIDVLLKKYSEDDYLLYLDTEHVKTKYWKNKYALTFRKKPTDDNYLKNVDGLAVMRDFIFKDSEFVEFSEDVMSLDGKTKANLMRKLYDLEDTIDSLLNKQPVYEVVILDNIFE